MPQNTVLRFRKRTDRNIADTYRQGGRQVDENTYERMMELPDVQFEAFNGVSKAMAAAMADTLRDAYSAKHKRRGRHAKLSIEIMLLLALEYWQQHTTFSELGTKYGIALSTAHDVVVWANEILLQSGLYSLQRNPKNGAERAQKT